VVGEIIYRRYISHPPEQIVEESLRRNCADPTRISETTRAALIEDARSRVGRHDHARAVVRANRQMMWALSARREDTWRVVRSVRVPALFVWGENDRLIGVDAGTRAVEQLPGSQLIVIDDCGHNPQMECPDEFASAAITFARSLDAKARA
jgi:pimeloyl-ACP methyl ester carboxylesterase